MTDEDRRFEELLQRLVDEVVSSVITASDQEIEEEMIADGRDPDAEAEDLRATMLRVADMTRDVYYERKERERRELEARENATGADSAGD